MPSLRKGASPSRISAGPGRAARPAVLLDSESPYGSRRVVVEYDGTTTAASLPAAGGPVAATWIANHGAAPQAVDPAGLSSGQAPQMPAAHTKHPQGRPPLDPAGPTWPRAGPATRATSSGRPRSAGRWIRP